MSKKYWCTQHNSHPTNCFEKHNPGVSLVKGTPSPEELRELTVKEHIRKQKALFSKDAALTKEKFSETGKRIMTNKEGIFPHKCALESCTHIVEFDDEPWCYKHSPDSGSSVKGYSARKEAEQEAS